MAWLFSLIKPNDPTHDLLRDAQPSLTLH